VPKAHTFSNGKDSSIGVLYYLEGGAKELPQELWETTFNLMQSEETMQLLKDPFHIDGTASDNGSDEDGEATSPEYHDGDIVF
jgi:hypothetical protein